MALAWTVDIAPDLRRRVHGHREAVMKARRIAARGSGEPVLFSGGQRQRQRQRHRHRHRPRARALAVQPKLSSATSRPRHWQ